MKKNDFRENFLTFYLPYFISAQFWSNSAASLRSILRVLHGLVLCAQQRVVNMILAPTSHSSAFQPRPETKLFTPTCSTYINFNCFPTHSNWSGVGQADYTSFAQSWKKNLNKNSVCLSVFCLFLLSNPIVKVKVFIYFMIGTVCMLIWGCQSISMSWNVFFQKRKKLCWF